MRLQFRIVVPQRVVENGVNVDAREEGAGDAVELQRQHIIQFGLVVDADDGSGERRSRDGRHC